MPIVVPPNEEQKAIADFLDTELSNIDQLITKQESLIEGLFERRASLISKIVVNGVRGPESAKKQAVRWLPDVPEHWQVVPLWSLFRREKTTGHPEMELLSLYREHGVLPKASRDDNHNVESDDLSNYQVVHQGDLVVNKMKAWQGSISFSSIQGISSTAYYVYRPYHDHNSKYFHYLLRSAPYIAEYNKMSKGVRIGQWDLEPQLFRTLPVLVPTELEQREIVDFLDAELEKNTFLMSQSSQLVVLLKERRDALISAAVTGRIDVRGKI
jgi:type I restriction enzyme S subunit